MIMDIQKERERFERWFRHSVSSYAPLQGTEGGRVGWYYFDIPELDIQTYWLAWLAGQTFEKE
jgi:hypothetical protein